MLLDVKEVVKIVNVTGGSMVERRLPNRVISGSNLTQNLQKNASNNYWVELPDIFGK
jgi:hypothetical protein